LARYAINGLRAKEQEFCCKKDWRFSSIGALLIRPGAVCAGISPSQRRGLAETGLNLSVAQRFRLLA
jgi:hypothetical protein